MPSNQYPYSLHLLDFFTPNLNAAVCLSWSDEIA